VPSVQFFSFTDIATAWSKALEDEQWICIEDGRRHELLCVFASTHVWASNSPSLQNVQSAEGTASSLKLSCKQNKLYAVQPKIYPTLIVAFNCDYDAFGVSEECSRYVEHVWHMCLILILTPSRPPLRDSQSALLCFNLCFLPRSFHFVQNGRNGPSSMPMGADMLHNFKHLM